MRLAALLAGLLCLLGMAAAPVSDDKWTPARKAMYRERARGAFTHAWDSYNTHAGNSDELKPLSCKGGAMHFGGLGLTLVDALDTLAVLGNRTEFRRVVRWIEDNLDLDTDVNVSLFESNIRVLGGLIR